VHCTPEQLALAALREPLPADDALHLDRCERCRDHVAALQRGVDALAVPELAAAGPGVPPPPAVWEAIAAATGVRVSPRPERTATADSGETSNMRPSPMQPEELARPRRLHNLFQQRLARAAVAAVAAAVLGAGIALGAVTLAHRPASTQVAATRLQALERNGAAGTAVVVEHHDHTLALEVTLTGSRPASGYYEAWLADAGLKRMVAVGALHDGTTTLPLPTGLRLASYPVIDVSVQQLDGNPAHSDHSVARGLLR
jgi:Anti-sigma-K factor rskA